MTSKAEVVVGTTNFLRPLFGCGYLEELIIILSEQSLQP